MTKQMINPIIANLEVPPINFIPDDLLTYEQNLQWITNLLEKNQPHTLLVEPIGISMPL